MKTSLYLIIATILLAILVRWSTTPSPPSGEMNDREEVVFWHFWGGRDRDIVENVVKRFNASQSKYWVRAIAMPGNNLQAKLFLSVTGGDPPDLVNQDDPILADWAARGIVQSMESIAAPAEVAQLREAMYAPARRLSEVDGELFAVCNGLDVRAMYYNKTLLDQHSLNPPTSIDALNQICDTISPPTDQAQSFYAYLPDSRRLWAWGIVFGGQFYGDSRVQLAHPRIQDALHWMTRFTRNYGSDNITAFRQGDQSLPGKSFPLLPILDSEMVGRYGLVMDGQWRTRDIAEFVRRREEQEIPCPEFGVCPLPYPTTGRPNAGWVNGNFFVIPKGADQPAGAWEFIKFWIGLNDPAAAAETCASGGWIPVSPVVVEHPRFQEYLEQNPLFVPFVELAASPNQFPVPPLPGAPFFKRTVEAAAYRAVTNPQSSVSDILHRAELQIQNHIDRQSTGTMKDE